jgi:hypothetical protein
MRDNHDDRRFTLRLDDELRERLKAEAHRGERSLCCEIKFRLRQTLAEQQRQPDHRMP